MNPFVPEIVLATARSSTPLPVWFMAAFPIFFGVMWVLSCTAMSRLTGHRALLERYPPLAEPVEKSFHFASGSMRWVDFRSALHVGIGAQGLHLAPNWLFRSPFYRGIPCIPWSEIHCVRPQRDGILGWFGGSRFEIPVMDLRFSLRGESGRAVESKLEKLSP